MSWPPTVFKAIRDLKKQKSPGRDNIYNEHVIYGDQPLSEALTLVFNSMQ